jgi:5-methylcytosine-specific restriction endonuclease McrA
MSSGRSGTGAWAYRKARAAVLADSDLCWLCGHGGAHTVDHVITARDWPPGTPGLDHPNNLRPAHGTMGNQAINPCPTCGRLCNQARNAKPIQPTGVKPW